MDEIREIPDPNYRPFSLFKYVCPMKAAREDGFPGLDTYRLWSKSERRLYRETTANMIARASYEIKQEARDLDDIIQRLETVDLTDKKSIEKLMKRLDIKANSVRK